MNETYKELHSLNTDDRYYEILINDIKTKQMKNKMVNKTYLEARVSELNNKRHNPLLETKEHQQIEHAIHYYINKIEEIDKKGLNYIEIETL